MEQIKLAIKKAIAFYVIFPVGFAGDALEGILKMIDMITEDISNALDVTGQGVELDVY